MRRRLLEPGRAGGPASDPHRPGYLRQERRQGDDCEPDAQNRQVDVDSRAGLGEPGWPDGHQRGRGYGHRDRDHRAGGGHQGHPGQGQQRETVPAHPEGAQDREFRRVEDELAVQQLPEDSQRDQAGQRGENRQRHRFRLNGPLGGRILGGQVDDLDGPHPVPRSQGDGLAGECGSGGTGLEDHVAGAAGRIEGLGQAGTGERGAQQYPRLGQLMGGWHDLVVGHHDGRHPEGQPDRAPDVGVAVPLRVPDQMQRPARPEVLPVGHRRADHDRMRVRRVEMRPARTLTRLMATPSPPERLASATMPEKGDAPGPGKDICRNATTSAEATCGRPATARK